MKDPVIDETSELSKRPRWYIVHTYSGFEQRVQKTIHEMSRTGQDQGLIQEVVVPTEKVIELAKGGEKRTTTRKFYPGYVMVRMIMTDLSWHLVQSIPKVTGFVGGKNRPTPMRDSEAERILALMETRQETPRPKFNFDRGDEVRVIDGPSAALTAWWKMSTTTRESCASPFPSSVARPRWSWTSYRFPKGRHFTVEMLGRVFPQILAARCLRAGFARYTAGIAGATGS